MKKVDNIPNDTGFKVPDGYFKSNFSSIKSRISLEKEINFTEKEAIFTMPDDYFKSSITSLKDRIVLEERLNKQTDQGFIFPENYFDSNMTILKDRVNLEKKLKEQIDQGFDIPENYLDYNLTILKDRVNLESILEEQTDQGFDVPNGYFEELENKLSLDTLSRKHNEDNEITITSKPSGKLISLKRHVYPAIAVAASLLILINVFFKEDETISTDNLELASITEYFDTYDTAFYEDDIKDLLTEEDLLSLENDVALEETDLINYLEDRTDTYDLYIQ